MQAHSVSQTKVKRSKLNVRHEASDSEDRHQIDRKADSLMQDGNHPDFLVTNKSEELAVEASDNSQMKSSKNLPDRQANIAVIDDFTDNNLGDHGPVVHKNGGIIEDPKSRKRTTSAFVNRDNRTSALDGIMIEHQIDNEVVSRALKNMVTGSFGQNDNNGPDPMSVTIESRKGSNFPLPNMMGRTDQDVIEPEDAIVKDEPGFQESPLVLSRKHADGPTEGTSRYNVFSHQRNSALVSTSFSKG